MGLYEQKVLPKHQTVVLLEQRPVGDVVTGKDLVIDRTAPVDDALDEDQVLVKVHWLSVDPAMRGWMSSAKSYLPPSPLGEPMRANGVGEVVKTSAERFKVGDMVVGLVGIQEFSKMDSKNVGRLRVPDGVSPSLALGVLGTNGLTAYFGLLDIGKPKPGETVVVSTAAGATGSIVAQIAKHVIGCRTIGIAGGKEKVKLLRDDLGLDETIDYKNENIRSALKRKCPDGIDVYFDNVGGETLNEALRRLNIGGRVSMCGSISTYNAVTPPPGPSNIANLIPTRGTIQGFVVLDYAKKYREAIEKLSKWIVDGTITYNEQVVDGIENAPAALQMLFTGQNVGKVVVRVAGETQLLKAPSRM